MNLETTLKINLNEEYKIKIEKGNEFNNSVFRNVYVKALSDVKDIVDQSSKENIYEDYNNIIAFAGERGIGKSSIMISFRDALVDKQSNDHKDFFAKEKLENSFAKIDLIDPSLFRGEESIFEIILANMFQKFQTSINDNKNNLSQDDKREIIKHFQGVFENLQVINSEKREIYNKESIEALSKLATSSNLKESFKKLVNVYLNKFEQKKDFLILAIDDFDLSYSRTYQILEDIRRFLIQPNVIILISLNKEQLSDSIFTSFKKEYSGNVIEEKLINRTSKYIEKLIPISRTIDIPRLSVREENNKIDLVYIIENDEITSKIPLNKTESISNLYQCLKYIISSRQSIYISSNDKRQNLFIPKTLREIIELVQNIYNPKPNEFRKYIISKSYNELVPEYSVFFQNIEENRNQFLLFTEQFIIDKFREYINPKLIEYINSSNNDHISIGDLVALFHDLDKRIRISNYQTLKFLDYLKVYISATLKEKKLLSSNRFIYNGFESLFPSESNTFRRDWVKFNLDYKISEHRNLDSIFLVYSLIHTYSSPDFDYRNSNYNYFFRFAGNFSVGVLNPFAIFTNYLEIKKNIRNNKNHNILDNLVKQYDESFIECLCDPTFVADFLEGVSEYARDYREKQPDYFNLIYIYLFNGGIESLEKMKRNSEFIISDEIIESFKEFPIFKLWRNELDTKDSFIRKIVNDMYESSKPENPNKKNINQIISDYLTRDLTKSRTRTNLKNKITQVDSRSGALKIINDFNIIYRNKTVNQAEKNKEYINLMDKLKRFING